MVPDSIRSHTWWDERVDPSDQMGRALAFKEFILKEYGYTVTSTNPTRNDSERYWLEVAKSKTATPQDLFYIALSLSHLGQHTVQYALKNSRLSIDKMELFLEIYRLEVDNGMYLLKPRSYTRHEAILDNKNIPAELLLDYLGLPASINYMKRLKDVLAHPNIPEYFLIDFMENYTVKAPHAKSDIKDIIECIEIIVSNRRGITAKVARLIVEGDKRFVKSATLVKLVRNQHVNPDVINLLVPDAKGRMRDGRQIPVVLLRALALNVTNKVDLDIVLQLLTARSTANQSASLVLGLADAQDEGKFIEIAWNARSKTIAMSAAQKTRDPDAYKVAVLLRNLDEDTPTVGRSILYTPKPRRVKKQYR